MKIGDVMSSLPPEPKDPKKPSNARITIWIVVAGFAAYMIISGIVGVVQHG